MNTPHVSLVIPAYNEENRLQDTLEQAFEFLHSQDYSSEVLIVENGSQDNTYAVAEAFCRHHENFRVLREERRGKGLAVKRGMLEATGDYRFMCDADLSMPVEEINRFMPPALEGVDIAIASREAPGSIRYNEPYYRHWGGRLINLIVRALVLPGFRDTQCGFKCFRGEVAEVLFRGQTLQGWSFDIELLFLARKLGYSIVEVPIPWYFNPESKLHLTRDAFRMLQDMVTIRLNDLRGVYDLANFPDIKRPAR